METKKEKQPRITIDSFSCFVLQDKRYKHLRLSVTHAKELRITAPKKISLEIIRHFVTSHKPWIVKRFSSIDSLPPQKTKEETNTEYNLLKKEAYSFVKTHVDTFSKLYNVTYKKITIKNQKRMWGSCSYRANLNFNYKIIKLPHELAMYIIIHEVCHLIEFNHSLRFWNLVGRFSPNYKIIKKELRQYEKSMMSQN